MGATHSRLIMPDNQEIQAPKPVSLTLSGPNVVEGKPVDGRGQESAVFSRR
jgi:hypothetical protein